MVSYYVDEKNLCIMIPIDALAEQAKLHDIIIDVKDKRMLADAVGKELCNCEDMGEEYYINAPMDDALERVIESGNDKIFEYSDEE